MDTSTVYRLKNYAIDLVICNIELFSSFDNIYLFGSVLQTEKIPNDIDILLTYSAYSEQIINDINILQDMFNNKSKLPVHLTTLSLAEAQEINFLEKLNSNFLKIKCM